MLSRSKWIWKSNNFSRMCCSSLARRQGPWGRRLLARAKREKNERISRRARKRGRLNYREREQEREGKKEGEICRLRSSSRSAACVDPAPVTDPRYSSLALACLLSLSLNPLSLSFSLFLRLDPILHSRPEYLVFAFLSRSLPYILWRFFSTSFAAVVASFSCSKLLCCRLLENDEDNFSSKRGEQLLRVSRRKYFSKYSCCVNVEFWYVYYNLRVNHPKYWTTSLPLHSYDASCQSPPSE